MMKKLLTKQASLSLKALLFSVITLHSVIGISKQIAEPPNEKNVKKSRIIFTESAGILPIENRGRRKWDGAIVGDLDGNGFQDLILTEHAYRVRVFWNEGGFFTGPQDLTTGDMHGLSIADLDNDGSIDVLVAQGGGGGLNPRKPRHFEIGKNRKFMGGEVLAHFEKSRGRSVKVFDANKDGILELFLTGFATAEQFKKGANHFYTNDGKGSFTFNSHLPFGHRLSYRSAITDFNNDNDPDILVFGGHDIIAIQGDAGNTFKDVTNEILGELTHINDISAISQFDFDKDGDLDLVISRAEHQFEHETYFDPENNRYAFFARFQPLQIDDLIVEGDFLLDNLQMAYPHFDVFIGNEKVQLEIDSKGAIPSFDWDRDGSTKIALSQKEAKGFPNDVCIKGKKINNLPYHSKPGLYIGHIGNGTWRICSQTKSPTAGVIQNVISHHESHVDEPLPAILLENKNGVFKDVTAKMGLNINEQTTSVVAADFDNDGWDDLLFSRYGNMAKENQQVLYMNQHGKSFELSESHGVLSKDLGATGSGVETIDYDKDGDLDLITANERGRWHLYTNHTEKIHRNNFIGVSILGSPSGEATALGAKAIVKACSNSAVRTVGNTSSAFAVTHNNDLLFGLGKCNKVDSINVQWTNGESIELKIKEINKYHVAGTRKK